MSRYNTKTAKARTGQTPIQSTTTAARNAKGARGFLRDPKSELFLLGVSNLMTPTDGRTYHEDGITRNARWSQLISEIAVADPAWMGGFLPWLRAEANLRTAPLTGALVATKAMLAAGITGSRTLVRDSILRADEPGEAVAFWFKEFGRKLPKPVKRGVSDAMRGLYNERSLLAYDTPSHGFRFADVIRLVHAKPRADWQSTLYKYAMDRRHQGNEAAVPETLSVIAANQAAKDVAVEELSADQIKGAGMRWENTISRATDKKAAWESQIPSMGYMALLRNLRNFDEAGVSDTVAQAVIAKLTDPEQVRRSRQFPFRFLSAFGEVNSLRWGYALEQALQLSLANLPEMSGRTLILVDQSGSMWPPYSRVSPYSNRAWGEVAALFGAALAIRNLGRSTLVQYGTGSQEIVPRPGTSVLNVMKVFRQMGGTGTYEALRNHFDGHDRVVLITDEQHNPGIAPSTAIPATTPLYTFNLVGYKVGSMGADPNRITIGGGLIDAAFRIIPLLEAGRDGAAWPWEEETPAE